MQPSIFKYSGYKVYIEDAIGAMPRRGRGVKLKMAEVMGCQSSFITQVLAGPAHFSPEQLQALDVVFEHTELEAEYFLFLLHFERAGTPALKEFYRRQLDRIILQELNLSKTIHTRDKLDERERAIYYSQWYYIAIHIAVTIGAYQNVDALCTLLHLPRPKILEALAFLKEVGLVTESDGRLDAGRTIVHLDGDSHHITKHHTHLRMKAIDSAALMDDSDLHYSSVVSVSRDDFEKLKLILLDTLKKTRAIINPSPAEELCVFNIDFFRWK